MLNYHQIKQNREDDTPVSSKTWTASATSLFCSSFFSKAKLSSPSISSLCASFTFSLNSIWRSFSWASNKTLLAIFSLAQVMLIHAEKDVGDGFYNSYFFNDLFNQSLYRLDVDSEVNNIDYPAVGKLLSNILKECQAAEDFPSNRTDGAFTPLYLFSGVRKFGLDDYVEEVFALFYRKLTDPSQPEFEQCVIDLMKNAEHHPYPLSELYATGGTVLAVAIVVCAGWCIKLKCEKSNTHENAPLLKSTL